MTECVQEEIKKNGEKRAVETFPCGNCVFAWLPIGFEKRKHFGLGRLAARGRCKWLVGKTRGAECRVPQLGSNWLALDWDGWGYRSRKMEIDIFTGGWRRSCDSVHLLSCECSTSFSISYGSSHQNPLAIFGVFFFTRLLVFYPLFFRFYCKSTNQHS